MEKNYDQPVSVKELEDISHYSYRNIQRIFKYSCGETIGAFQQRLKVENAYKRILYTQENLTSIAIEVGFANIASFSKAFKQHFGISPKAAKQKGTTSLWRCHHPCYLRSLTGTRNCISEAYADILSEHEHLL